jgi:polyhydroxyalkanoate synthesis regulator phasin
LKEIVAMTKQKNTPNGKPSLPDLILDDLPQDEGDPQKKLTVKDQEDFNVLEEKLRHGTRLKAEALREIRFRGLWRLATNETGEKYPTFDAYCQERWNCSRQYVTQLTNWLRVREELESMGLESDISVKAAQGLLPSRIESAGGIRVVLEEAQGDGVAFSFDGLREITLRRAEYESWKNEMPAADYETYKQDLKIAEQLAACPHANFLLDKAKSKEGNLVENIVTISRENKAVPYPDSLVREFTGDELVHVVDDLLAVAHEAQTIVEKKEALHSLNAEIKKLQEEGGLVAKRQHAKQLKEELDRLEVSEDVEAATAVAENGAEVIASNELAQDSVVLEEPRRRVQDALTQTEVGLSGLLEAIDAGYAPTDDEIEIIMGAVDKTKSVLRLIEQRIDSVRNSKKPKPRKCG